MYQRWKFVTGVFVLSISLVIASGCSDQSENDIARIEDPAKVEQDADANDPLNGEQEEVKQEEKTVETDPSVMVDFQALLDKQVTAAELKVFVDNHITKVSNEDSTTMVLALEDLQREQIVALEERLYNGDQFQEQLMEIYQSERDLDNLDKVSDPDLKQLLTDVREGGYKVETAEGIFFPIIDYQQYVKYQVHVEEDIRDYIVIKAAESNEVSVKDASLIIGWDEVVNRALSQEQFILTYPGSVRMNEVKQLFGGYVYITFNGIDNTPLFGYMDNTYVVEAETAYTEAIQGGIDHSPYLQKLSEFLDLIKKNGFKQTDEVAKFQEETTQLWAFSNE
jgi:hypothetical protein